LFNHAQLQQADYLPRRIVHGEGSRTPCRTFSALIAKVHIRSGFRFQPAEQLLVFFASGNQFHRFFHDTKPLS
jgi:hypothetical protein